MNKTTLPTTVTIEHKFAIGDEIVSERGWERTVVDVFMETGDFELAPYPCYVTTSPLGSNTVTFPVTTLDERYELKIKTPKAVRVVPFEAFDPGWAETEAPIQLRKFRSGTRYFVTLDNGKSFTSLRSLRVGDEVKYDPS